MPEVVSRKCPHCSGNLPPLGDSEKVTCEYCGYEFDVRHTTEQPVAPAPAAKKGFPKSGKPAFARPKPPRLERTPVSAPVTARAPTPVVVPAATRGIRAIGCLAVLVPLIAVVGSGAFSWLRTMPGASIPSLSAIVEPAYTFHRTVGFFQANADGVEDVAMIVRTVLSGDDMHLVMFDGATGHELWKVGELGSYTQGYQYTYAAVAERRVMLTDFRGQVRLFDLGTGAPIAAFALPDRAKALCAGQKPGQVRLTLQNGSKFIFDIPSGAGGAPEVVELGEPTCVAPPDLAIPQAFEAGVSIPGLEEPQRMVQGDLRVAVGRRSSGVRVPMAVGLAADGQTPVWTMIVPTVAETMVDESGSDALRCGLGAGRLYCAYSLTSEGARIAAFDARTGARLWETEFRGWASSVDVDALRVGPNRLVIEQFGEAELFDAATGSLLRRIAPR
jgi:hypothetical protein